MNARSLCGALALLLAPPAYAGKQGPNTGGGSISYSTRGYATEAEAHRAEQREAAAKCLEGRGAVPARAARGGL